MNRRAAAAFLGLAVVLAGGCASHEPVEDGPSRAMTRLPREAQAAAAGYIDSLYAMATTLTGVTDTASARSAMPALEAELSGLSAHWKTLEGLDERRQADARYAYYRDLANAERRFESQVSRVKGTPGVGTTLAPLLDKIPRWR